jgi:hypothetical protein
MTIIKNRSQTWRERFIRSSRTALLCTALVSCRTAAVPHTSPQWNERLARFAEYLVSEPKGYTATDLLTVLDKRFVITPRGTPIHDRERMDISIPLEIYRNHNAFFFDRLPIFAPSDLVSSTKGVEFDCTSNKDHGVYNVTCRSTYSGDEFRSQYDPMIGVPWFEYYCGSPKKICKFAYSKGANLLSRAMLLALRKRGEIRTK